MKQHPPRRLNRWRKWAAAALLAGTLAASGHGTTVQENKISHSTALENRARLTAMQTGQKNRNMEKLEHSIAWHHSSNAFRDWINNTAANVRVKGKKVSGEELFAAVLKSIQNIQTRTTQAARPNQKEIRPLIIFLARNRIKSDVDLVSRQLNEGKMNPESNILGQTQDEYLEKQPFQRRAFFFIRRTLESNPFSDLEAMHHGGLIAINQEHVIKTVENVLAQARGVKQPEDATAKIRLLNAVCHETLHHLDPSIPEEKVRELADLHTINLYNQSEIIFNPLTQLVKKQDVSLPDFSKINSRNQMENKKTRETVSPKFRRTQRR